MGQVESCDCYEDRKRARVGIVPTEGVAPTAPGRLGTPSSSMKIPPGPITALNDHARLLPVTSDEFDVVCCCLSLLLSLLCLHAILDLIYVIG